MKGKFIIAALAATGFWRCGTYFPQAGKVVLADDFDEKQWEILKAEPKLRIREADKDDLEDLEARADTIAEAIKALAPADFQNDGKPKVAALNELLAGDLDTKVSADERNTVWDALVDEGFKAPTDDPQA